MKFRTLLLIFWLILALIGIFSFASKAQANGSFELTYAGQPGPLFNETNLAPLSSVTKQITVKNLTDSSQKFALNLQNLLGTPDEKLAAVLTVDISRGGNSLYNSKLSTLKDTETFLENIPASTTYVYDIKVAMDDVGNEYQAQEVKFDLIFGWLEQAVSGGGTKGILGESVGPEGVISLPETGYNAVLSVITVLIGLFLVAGINIFILKLKARKKY